MEQAPEFAQIDILLRSSFQVLSRPARVARFVEEAKVQIGARTVCFVQFCRSKKEISRRLSSVIERGIFVRQTGRPWTIEVTQAHAADEQLLRVALNRAP